MKKVSLWFIFVTLITILFLTGCCAVSTQLNLAEVEEIELLIAKSFPIQIYVMAKGYLPNP